MRLDKHPHKNQNTKNLLKICKYISGNATFLFKQAKCRLVTHYRILKLSNTIKVSSACLPVSLPACQLTGINLAPIPLSIQPSNFMKIKVISVSMNLCYSDRNTRPMPSFVLCSFVLTDWSCLKQRCWHSIKVLTFNKGVIIPCKVLKYNSKQVG